MPSLHIVEVEQLSNDSIPEYIAVSHQWKELEDWAYLFEVPSPNDISRWKKEFEKANATDSVWYADYEHIPGEGHWVAVNDFIELWHGPLCESFKTDDNRTLWRLLQYSPGTEYMQYAKGFTRIELIRKMYIDLLDYITGSQWDMTFRAWLLTDFATFYIRILYRDIEGHMDGSIKSAILREQKQAQHHHDRVWEAYQKIEGGPGFNGSSYPARCGLFGNAYYGIEIFSQEEFLHTIYNESYNYLPTGHVFTEDDIINEYEAFSGTFTDDEYSFSVEARRDVLDKDKKSFFDWMAARETVSLQLSGRTKMNFDRATDGIRRHKLIMLKNRYNIDNGYCSEYISKHLLSINSSDEEIISHNLEKLIDNE